MERTRKDAEYDICFVPCHHEELHAHQSHFGPQANEEDPGFQIDEHDTQTGTAQICQAELRELDNCPTCQRFPGGFCGNQGRQIPQPRRRLPPRCARCDDVPGEGIQNNRDNVYNARGVGGDRGGFERKGSWSSSSALRCPSSSGTTVERKNRQKMFIIKIMSIMHIIV